MFERLAEGVFVQPSLLFQTVAVIVSDKSGVTVIDPGYFPHECDGARAAFEQHRASAGDGRFLALTHSDFDHIVGAPYFTDLPILVHDSWDHDNERRARAKIREFDADFYIERSQYADGPLPIQRRVTRDGEEVASFLAFHAAGHTRDGLVLFHRPSRALLVGDYLSSLEIPFIFSSALDYRDTLKKFSELVKRLDVAIVVSQHGPPSLSRDDIDARLRASAGYIDALLSAAEQADSRGEEAAEHVASATSDAWPGGVAAGMRPHHVENARMALREAAKGSEGG